MKKYTQNQEEYLNNARGCERSARAIIFIGIIIISLIAVVVF